MLGAYGEVRRAIHRKTNLIRAVKIIYKESTSKEEQERVINEVNILKNLVIYPSNTDFLYLAQRIIQTLSKFLNFTKTRNNCISSASFILVASYSIRSVR